MSDEKIIIEVTDKVSTSIQTKLRAIATDARTADVSIVSLRRSLETLTKVNGLAKLQADLKNISAAFNGAANAASLLSSAAAKTALANQKLATEAQKTQAALTLAQAAISKLAEAQAKAQTATVNLSAAQTKALVEAQKLATAQQQTAAAATRAAEALSRLTTAQNNAATSAQRLLTEQQRTATAQSNASTAATRLQTEQQRLAAATVRVTTEQAKAATAAQKLATEQQRTASAAANAAAANDRAALAALRLAEAQRQAGSASSGAASSMKGYVAAALAAVGVGIGAGGIIATADAYTLLTNKLQNVASSQTQVAEITERLFDIANRTTSSIDSTATAFARFDRSLKGMGKSQEETLRLTETINKALIVGGASATEASSALLQLSQAFNAGYLMGDEFRSVSENMPMVLDAVSKTLNKPIDQIKKLASEGKITAKVMFDAFKLIEKDVDGTFAKMDMTVGQSRVVFSNYFTKYVGEIDKAYGITATMARGVVTLAKNLDDLAFAAALAGIALTAALGPTLVATFNKAKLAVIAFNASLLANPIILVASAIAAVTAAIVIYGDEVDIVAKHGSFTLKDAFRTAFTQIGNYADEAGKYFSTLWDGIIDGVNSVTGGSAEQFRSFFDTVKTLAKFSINTIIGTWVSLSKAITIIWNNLPAIINAALGTTVNFVSTAISQILNLWQLLFKGLAELAEKVSPDLAASINSGLDKLKIELPKVEVSKAGEVAAKDLSDAIKGAMTTDYLGNFADQASRDARRRRQAAGVRGRDKTELRGEGVSQLSGNKPDKAAESRAKSMAKVNLELDNEIQRMGMLKPLREAQAKYDQIEESLAGKKIKLSAQESASIKEKIKTVQDATMVQAEYDRIYQESVGPVNEYQSALAAADKLIKQGAITQAEYNKQVAKSKESYANALDPLRQTNIGLDQQMDLLRMIQPDREIAQQLQQVDNQLRTQGLSIIDATTKSLTAEGEAIRQKIIAIQQATAVQQQYDSIYAQTKGAQDAVRASVEATTLAYKNGLISAEQYGIRINQLGVEAARLRIDAGNALPGDASLSAFGQIIDGYKGMLSGLAASFGDLFTNITDGFANAIAGAIMGTESLGDALKNVAQQAVQQLIASLIKLGIQYAINAAISQSLGVAAVAATAGLATTTAAAWAPAAAAASLATLGANAAPAAAAIVSTNAVSMGAALAGFSKGGYTGGSNAGEVRGLVHGKEFVMNAEATQRIGVGNLEAMQDGRMSTVEVSASKSRSSASGGDSGVKINFTLINNSNNTEVTQKQSQDENGEVDFVVTVNNLENALASRVSSGRGPLHNATKNAFGLNANPQGGRT